MLIIQWQNAQPDTFHNFFKIIHKELLQRWPLGSLQSIEQLLNFCRDSATYRDTCSKRNKFNLTKRY